MTPTHHTQRRPSRAKAQEGPTRPSGSAPEAQGGAACPAAQPHPGPSWAPQDGGEDVRPAGVRLPHMMPDLADLVAREVAQYLGAAPEVAQSMGWSVVEAFCQRWGGVAVYVPKADVLERASLYERIWQEFDGRNHEELARRHGITVVWVYQIVKRMRALDRARRQMPLAL